MSNIVVAKFGIDFPLKSLAEVRFNSPSVQNIPETPLIKFIVTIIGKTFLKCGQTVSTDELNLISSLFKEELVMFPYITTVEIEKAFSNGYKEKYGKYYGLNVKTFIGWLDGYIKNERNDDLNSLKPKKEVVKNAISPDEAKKLISSGMKKCINHWSENNSILDGYVNFLYDVLFDDGYLPKDYETKNKFIADAKTVLEFEVANKKAKTRDEHLEIKEIKNAINKPKSTIVINKAKELIVCKFMRDTWRNEKEIKNLKEKYEYESP